MGRTVAEYLADAARLVRAAAEHADEGAKLAKNPAKHEQAEKEYTRAGDRYRTAADDYLMAGESARGGGAYENAGDAYMQKALINLADGTPGDLVEAKNAFNKALESWDDARRAYDAANSDGKKKEMERKIKQIEREYGKNGTKAQLDLTIPTIP